MSYLTRKAIAMATITIEVNEYEAPPKPPNESTETFTHIDIVQSASGVSNTNENRCVDDVWREHSDWLFGTVKGRTIWVSADEITDEYLKAGWDKEGDGKNLIFSEVESQDSDWIAKQVWGFQTIDGVRRYTRNVLVAKGDERAELKMIYDFTPEE